jgi:hypothetical protein
MMYQYPHVIRLRGFWERAPGSEPDEAGCRYCRRFGAPTGLDYHERVWLVCQAIAAPATIELNGEDLGKTAAPHDDFECDITSRMQSRNEVCLRLVASDLAPADPPPAIEEPARAVRLEIRTTLTLP